MSLFSRNIFFQRIIFPNVDIKDIYPVASLFSPRDLLVTMTLVSLLSQLSENFKGILDFKDVQRLSSIKFYSKVLMFARPCLTFSSIFSVSKTLGQELELLVSLSSKERFNFLYNVLNSLIVDNSSGKLSSEFKAFNDPFELFKYRKALSLKCRSVMLATSIFLPHSIVFGIPVSQINLELIVRSCRSLWSFWGLDIEDFDFLLYKDAYSNFYNVNEMSFLKKPSDSTECLKIILWSVFKNFSNLKDGLIFDDNIILRNDKNIVRLENELGFIQRSGPLFPNELYLSSYDLKDNLIRVAADQRKSRALVLESMVKNSLDYNS
uniref:Maturase n=1 Tax=Trachelomonas volvocina TaxID=103340 RepID=A0A0G3VR58_9EUGL|nr:maturase [Trachelomonas volvocina]AKL82465.1 maturase [Trachelomonas volvocina]